MGVAQEQPTAIRSAPVRGDIFSTLGEWTDFLQARGFAPKTVDSYAAYVLRAARVQRRDPRDFTERDVVQAVASYPTKGAARGMLIRSLRAFFEWATDIDVGEMMLNPARRIAVPRPKYGAAPRLSREELEALWTAAETLDPRAAPALKILYYTGARVGSFCEVTPADVRFDRYGKPSIHFAVTKGDKPYDVPIEAPEAVDALVELVRLRGYTPRTVTTRRPTLVGVGTGTVWGWVSRAGELAGVHAWPHLIRHTTLSDLAEDPDVAVGEWTQIANHADPSLFRRYVAPSDPRTRRAVGRLGHADARS